MSTSARIIRDQTTSAGFVPFQFPEQDNSAPIAAPRPRNTGRANHRRPAQDLTDDVDESPVNLEAQARAQAKAILNEANLAAKSIEEKAYGLGYAAGQAAAVAAAEERLKQIQNEYQASVARLRRVREEMVVQCEEEIVRLVLEVAKKVVQREVSVDREIVLTLIKVALKRIDNATAITIRVHHEDYKALESRRHEFLSGDNGVVNLIEDRSISRGGCLIETEFGQVDARIERQFKEIERGFFGQG